MYALNEHLDQLLPEYCFFAITVREDDASKNLNQPAN